MAQVEVRTANEAGRAVMVLSDELDAVLFANRPARALFGDAGSTASGPIAVPSKLAAVAPMLREDGEAMMRLKAKAGGLELWVTAHLFMTSDAHGAPFALLTAPLPLAEREAPQSLAARLLAESGLEDAAIFAAGRLLSAGAHYAGGVSEEDARIEAFLRSGEAAEATAAGGLWRVGSELVLLRPAAQPLPEPIRPGALGLGALVDRWRSRNGEEASVPARAPAPAVTAVPPQMPETPAPAPVSEPSALDRLSGEPVRFVWQIDADGRFRQLSPEFAGIVGAGAADVLGIPFTDVADAFALDDGGEIAGLLERRETWSGRSVHWPVEGTDRKVLVDLAALPTYTRDRRFDGFRGFGIVRPRENVADPEAIGLALAATAGTAAAEPASAEGPDTEPGSDTNSAEAFARDFGRRTAPPGAASGDRTVVSLEERRRREALLSPAEEDAFKAIGKELSPLVREAGGRGATRELDGDTAAILSAVPSPLLVETAGRLVFANPGLLQLTGYEGLDDLVAAGGLDALFAEAEAGERVPETVRLRRADGSARDARVQMQRARLTGQSSLVFTFAPLEPSPLSEETVEALRDEMSELRSVLDTATDGILLLDAAGAVRSMNGSAQSLLGVGPGAFEGRPFTDFLAPASRRSAADYLDSLRDEGLAAILNDGREVMAEVAGRGSIPIFLTIGRLAEERGWCVLLRDIEQWKRVEQELVAARRQAEDASLTKSRFLANIGHELRTPLNAIIGFADVMAAETYGPVGHERYLDYLRDIKRSGHHVLDLVNDLLDISKIEAGKVELSFEAVSLNEVVGEVVSLMQPQANRQRVLVRSNLPAGIPPVVADRRTLRQIALNLVANAIRFTPAGGQIIASTGHGEDGQVMLRFRDSGIGMTDREIEIALTPFQQVNAAGGERGEGTGLGLPLTKAMVEANRALFHIASTPGEGTLIEITFPAQRVLAH